MKYKKIHITYVNERIILFKILKSIKYCWHQELPLITNKVSIFTKKALTRNGRNYSEEIEK